VDPRPEPTQKDRPAATCGRRLGFEKGDFLNRFQIPLPTPRPLSAVARPAVPTVVVLPPSCSATCLDTHPSRHAEFASVEIAELLNCHGVGLHRNPQKSGISVPKSNRSARSAVRASRRARLSHRGTPQQ
jgi:hypothetical protein